MIKTVAVVSYLKKQVEKELKKHNFKLNNKKPEAIVCFGGEGTFLYSEQIYPGVPKLLIKHSTKQCKNCGKHDFSNILNLLKNNKLKIIRYAKLESSLNKKRLVGLNDINIHYKVPCALRFSVYVNNKAIAKSIVGDGVIVSTPYGSSAYFKSITGKIFSKGFGIAFNNPTKKLKENVVGDKSVITVKILRGGGLLAADCNKEVIRLKTGDVIKIRKANDAKIIKLKNYDTKIKLKW